MRHIFLLLVHTLLLSWCLLGSVAGQFSANQRYIVLILSRLGFANRMHSIVDWYQVALESNRSLIVSWEANPDLNIEFHELYKEIPKNMKILPFVIPYGDSGLLDVAEMCETYNLSYITIGGDHRENYFGDRKEFVLKKEIAFSDTNVIITNYDGEIVIENYSCNHYMSMKSRIMQQFIPVDHAQKSINNIIDKYFLNKLIIGIQIRYHDPIHDWNVVPPDRTSEEAAPFGYGATLYDFENVMKSIDNKLRLHNNATQHKFFLASNNPEFKEYLLSKFVNIVTLKSESYSRNTSEGIYHAFLEFLMLSRSDFIVNTYGSTFAVEASSVFMKPLASIFHSKVVVNRNVFLPFCSHMAFIKSYSTQGESGTFVEGTIDQRRVESKTIYLTSCGIFSEWGLNEVYCNNRD